MRSLALILSFVLCTSSSLRETAAQDLSGLWKGRWSSPGNGVRREHGGTLRMRLRPISSDGYSTVYKGTFAGRFAVVIPYFYRSRVYQDGNVLRSTKRLGPFGSYQMHLHAHPGGMSANALHGSWSAGKHRGGIQLAR